MTAESIEAPAGGSSGEERPRGLMVRRAVVFLLLVLFLAASWLGIYPLLPGPGVPGQQVTVRIPRQCGPAVLEQILRENRLIRRDPRFAVWVRLLKVRQGLKAGDYLLTTGRPTIELLRALAAGRVQPSTVTIPEGWVLGQVADVLTAGGWVDGARFLALARDRAFIEGLGVGAESLEGYLFPDTYQLTMGEANEEWVLRAMVGRFREVFGSLQEAAGDTSLDSHQVVILASIVEKETGLAEERPLVARVFLNRLELGMKLQADPTVVYGIAGFDGNLTRQHLETPSPYNTYTQPGLPAGPICNPGRAALEAVLQPADGDFLYFVARKDGTHQFSRTLAEHNRAVNQYQRNP